MKYKQPTPRQVKKARKRRHREDTQVQRCYCVCHIEFASKAWCRHCHGDNDVVRFQRTMNLFRSLHTLFLIKGP